MKTIVAYFSVTGNTAKKAGKIAKLENAELYEIRPEFPYQPADLDYRNPESRSSREMKDESSRPPLAEPAPDLSAYDTLYIGFPIWWGVAPRVINTFLDSCDLNGKKIVVFVTSGGSGSAYAVKALKKQYPGLDISARAD